MIKYWIAWVVCNNVFIYLSTAFVLLDWNVISHITTQEGRVGLVLAILMKDVLSPVIITT